MFTNAKVFHAQNLLDHSALQDALEKFPFTAITASDTKSQGWVPPRGEEGGALVESVQGQWLLRFKTETRHVPGELLKQRVDEMAAKVEIDTGRKPGKRERKDLKEQAHAILLPQIFPKTSLTWVWIDPGKARLVIDSTSSSKTDAIITALIKTCENLIIQDFETNLSTQVVMGEWLTDEGNLTDGFSVGKACELKSADESQSAVRYTNHSLHIDEIRQHLAQGKLPTLLALEWDDRVGFVLNTSMELKKIKFADSVMEAAKAQRQRADDFEGNFLMTFSELNPLIDNLFTALGGINTQNSTNS